MESKRVEHATSAKILTMNEMQWHDIFDFSKVYYLGLMTVKKYPGNATVVQKTKKKQLPINSWSNFGFAWEVHNFLVLFFGAQYASTSRDSLIATWVPNCHLRDTTVELFQ
jgi:hypothetical protein